MKKALLLDFDGVVFRNNPLDVVISHRCQMYSNKFVSIRNPIKLREFNTEIYNTYGHTLVGLQKLGHVKANINEFNSYVYDGLIGGDLRSLKDTHYTDIKSFKRLLSMAQDNDIKVFMFSNAPDKWCNMVCHYMGISENEQPTSLHGLLLESSVLKPSVLGYMMVERELVDFEDLFLLDDKMLNLKNIMYNSRWTKLLMSPSSQDTPIQVKNDCFMVNSLDMAIDLTVQIQGGSQSSQYR